MKEITSLANPRHLMRYLKAQAMGGTEAEKLAAIAKSEGVSAATVKQSVCQVDRYYKQNSNPQMEVAIRSLVISAIPLAQQSLSGLLMATELVEMPDSRTGKKKIVKREDKTTRLEANRLVKDLIVAVQPKGPAVELNVSQTNQVANLSTAETTEERFRRLREKAKEFNQLPPETVGVPENIDRDEEEDDDEEDE